MNTHTPRRGGHLVRADRGFATGGRTVAWLVGAGFHKLLDRIDEGLLEGALEADLPDGSFRILGGRKPGPVAIVKLNSWRALVRLAGSGSVGWYKAWELGEWESPDPVPLFDLFMRNGRTLGSAARAKGKSRWLNRLMHYLRRNSRSGAKRNIAAHYDLGNDFYATWLDDSMTYSSALFADGDDLAAGQRRKMGAVLDRLQLTPGQRLLEIGCGWGAFAKFAAQHSGARVTAISLSQAQLDWAATPPVPDVDFRLCDYRDVTGPFDAIASIEMVEAVGQGYWPDYLDAIARNLKPGGRAAIQYIAIDDALFDSYAASADFIQTYIFPGGCLLSESRFRALAGARGLHWQDQHVFGQDYADTLKIWRERFDNAVEAGRLPAGFDAHFVRLWRYYLMYCEGGFRGRGIHVAQVTLVKV